MPNVTPLVSVIIPCWNQAHFLGESVGSVKVQTYPNWEILIVNDGSPDNTKEVALALAQTDQRIRYVEQSNRGLASARNRGLALARGDYVQFLDADDIILPAKLARQVSLLVDRFPEKVVSFCDYAYGRRDDTQIGAQSLLIFPAFVSDNQCVELLCRWETSLSIPAHAFLFPRSLFDDGALRFDEDLPNHEDWDCWMRIAHSGVRFLKCEGVLVIYRTSSCSMSQQRAAMLSGFEQAVDGLTRLWNSDKELVKLLGRKRNSIRIAYDANVLYRNLGLLLGEGWFKRFVPWPFQRWLIRFLREGKELALPRR